MKKIRHIKQASQLLSGFHMSEEAYYKIEIIIRSENGSRYSVGANTIRMPNLRQWKKPEWRKYIQEQAQRKKFEPVAVESVIISIRECEIDFCGGWAWIESTKLGEWNKLIATNQEYSLTAKESKKIHSTADIIKQLRKKMSWA